MKLTTGRAFAKVGGQGQLVIDLDELAGAVTLAGAEKAAEVIERNLRNGQLPDGTATPTPKLSSLKRGTKQWGIRTGQLVDTLRASPRGKRSAAVETDAEFLAAAHVLGGVQNLNRLANH